MTVAGFENWDRFARGNPVSLPEWSKGLRSGRNVFERVGSNPTADKALCIHAQQGFINPFARIRCICSRLTSPVVRYHDPITVVKLSSSKNGPENLTIAP